MWAQNNIVFKADSLFPVYGVGNYTGKADCSSNCTISTDFENLYINVRVEDDKLIFNNSIYSDHFEFWLALNNGDANGYIRGSDKYLYQYMDKPLIKSLKAEIENPYITGGSHYGINYLELDQNAPNSMDELLIEEVDEYLIKVRTDSLKKEYVFYGVSHFGVYPASNTVEFYDREGYNYFKNILGIDIENLSEYIKTESYFDKNGYQLKIKIPFEAIGFMEIDYLSQFKILADVVDCDKTDEQSTILSTSKDRKWGDTRTFKSILFNKNIGSEIIQGYKLLNNSVKRKLSRYLPYLFILSKQGWVGIQKNNNSWECPFFPETYSFANIQSYYFSRVEVFKTEMKHKDKILPVFNIDDRKYILLNENNIFDQSQILEMFSVQNGNTVSIVYENDQMFGRIWSFDYSKLYLIKDNGESLIIGKSDGDLFIFNDSLKVENSFLNQFAMERNENIPWSNFVKIDTLNHKVTVDLETSVVECEWDENIEILKYKLVKGKNEATIRIE